MSHNWKRMCLVLTEIILLVSSLSLDVLPQNTNSSTPAGDDALLLMIAVYSRLEASSGAAVLPSGPHIPRALPVSFTGPLQQNVQDQINENETMAELYWTYFENAKDDKQKEYFATRAQAYSDAAKALDAERDRKRRRQPGIARFFRGVGRVINKVVGGIVVGGAKATEFIVDEAIPMYIQLMIKTLPDKHINLMWDKLAARLGGGPAGEYLVKKIRKFIEPYFLRMRDHIFKRREPNPIKTEEVETTGGDLVNAEGAWLFIPDGMTFGENEIYLHFDPEGGTITGEGKKVIINVDSMDGSTLTSYQDVEFKGAYTAESKSFEGVVWVKSYYTCTGDEICPERFDYPANWWATLEGKTITGNVDGLGDIELVVK